VAGTAAGLTFTIAFSGAGSGSVNVHNTSTEAAPLPVETTIGDAMVETTSTTEAPTTTTTEAPTTTTTVAPVTTTTTVPPKVAAPTVNMNSPVPGATVTELTVMFVNRQGARNVEMFPHPAVRIAVTYVDGTTGEVVAPLPAQNDGSFTVALTAPATGATVTDTEWDGGSLPTGRGELEK
jgi:hypothetical protein